VLRLPAYRRLLAVLVYRRTGSALGTTAFFICSQVLPAFAAPVAVSRLDRHPPRRVLPALYAIEGVLFGVLAWMTSRFSLAPVLALALLDGIMAIVARALARTASVEVLRGPGLLHEGNAVTNGVVSLCFMAGPAVGGAVVVAGGTVAALLANCGLFAGIAVILATGALPGPSRDGATTGGRLRSGLDHVRRSAPLRTLLSLQALGMVFFTISIPVEVVFAQHSLHAGAGGYGALMSAWGAGAVIGSAAYARWRRASARILISLSAAALGIGFAVMAAAPSIVVAVIGAALGGMSNGIEMVAARTAVQERTSEQWMALVMSLNEAVAQVTPGLGILLGGVITALLGPRLALGVAAVGSLAFTAAAWVSLAPSRFAALPEDRNGPVEPPASPANRTAVCALGPNGGGSSLAVVDGASEKASAPGLAETAGDGSAAAGRGKIA
jgi:predicted MFS family arabinose efflux permease